MAEVTVTELAKSVGAPVERLLKQMKEAGLKQSAAEATVSDDEKQILLAFLKNSHGEQASESGKITLKRKTTSTLKAGTGRKTVSVETRKKRTYVKRDETDAQAADSAAAEQAEAAELANQQAIAVAAAKAAEDAQSAEAAKAEAEAAAAEESAAKAEAESLANEQAKEKEQAEAKAAAAKAKSSKAKVKAEPAPVVQRSYADDAETMRQAAILRRKAEEAKKKADKAKKAKALAEENRRIEEEKATKAAELATKNAEQAAAKKAEKDASVKTAKPAGDAKAKGSDGVVKAKTAAGPHEYRKAAAPAGGDREELSARKKPAHKAAGGKKKGNKKDLLNIKDDLYEEQQRRKKFRAVAKLENKHGFKKPTDQITHEVEIFEGMTVSELAQGMAMKAGAIVKSLMKMGVMATMNQPLDLETAQLVVEETDHTFKIRSENAVEEQLELETTVVDGVMVNRAPVVTVMGHVDHGKTSLLDYIRETKVTSGEAGGITQHIGAYRVKTSQGEIAFLDTPGHAAFTAMRARGASCTDIVILVVAADDGVMPQTEEAILHARAANVPLVVAINKCDKDAADPERVKNELVAKGVVPEDWGGDTQFIQVSAHTGAGVDELLEAISLQAELLELQAVVDTPAKGVVIESRVDKGRGVVATILVQSGTLNRSDILLAGQSFGRVRAMTNELGLAVDSAGPSTPIEILGLDSAPNAGDDFLVVADERKAREVAEHRTIADREEKLRRQQASKLENIFANLGEDQQKILPVIVKADVRGSMEAIQASLLDLGNDEVQVNVISSGVGGITDNDINLAISSGAIVIGFNVRAGVSTRAIAEKEAVEIRYYSIIYQLLDEVKAALSGMLDPERVEEILGVANVREVFSSPKFGQVAGCMVVEGTVHRSKPIRVLRDNVVIYEGALESLRRFKDDVPEVRNGTECGIGVKNYDVKVGDQIEVYSVKEVARSL